MALWLDKSVQLFAEIDLFFKPYHLHFLQTSNAAP